MDEGLAENTCLWLELGGLTLMLLYVVSQEHLCRLLGEKHDLWDNTSVLCSPNAPRSLLLH